MQNSTFLHQIAKQLLNKYSNSLSELVIVLPNKRAKVFLIQEFKNCIENTIIAPEIISIEEFIQDISGLRSIDSIQLLFEFYEVYASLENDKKEQFENFANWAKTLLQDFNEIDRYLIEPDKILKYLENIKEIEHWSVDNSKKTDLIVNYLAFWKKLPIFYHALYNHLLQKGIGYQGLIYREAEKNLNFFIEHCNNKKFIFAGFNALNKAEEIIIQQLLANDLADIYWDIDETFLNDNFHDAALFQRRFKSTWSYYKINPYEWISNHFKEEKNIHIIGTSKSIGQAKIAGKLIEDLANKSTLENTAIILGDENMLVPTLHALPENVSALNITMGYSSKNNPIQLLISKFFKLHVNAATRQENNYVFYYKELLEVLTHPLIENILNCSQVVDIINKYNFTFITPKKIVELQNEPNDLFNLIVSKWDNNALEILDKVSKILLIIKSSLDYTKEEDKLTNTFLYSIFNVINKIASYFEEHNPINDIKTLYSIYKQVVDLAEVSFEGEPLSGLQIMGVLESRVLDFENIIITSVNEGKFPAGKSSNSFIPYDVKLEYGLPTFKEKDAIYTYHFYHLLQRAKNIYLVYNSDSDGFDSGEKSRFITQLLVEKQKNHTISVDIYNADVPNIASQPIVIPKTETVMLRLKEMNEKGFSPSTLTTYIRNPIQFYFQRILKISEAEEVEENIAVNTLGTIIHGVLEELYKPLIGKILIEEDIKACIKKVNDEVLKQFKLVYKEGEISKGKNLLAFEVAKRNVLNFLNLEIESIQKNEIIQIIALEADLQRTLVHKNLPFPVKIAGKVDRIENRNGKIRIIDYKTGKVEQKNLTLKNWNGLTQEIDNDKIIQVLAYAFMYEPNLKGLELEAGIISFKNMKSGFLPFNFKEEKDKNVIITPEIMQNYIEEIVILLNEILSVDVAFEEKV